MNFFRNCHAMNPFVSAFFVLITSLALVNYFDRNPAINQSTKTCVVTGASSGIGRELAVQMIKRGWKVIGVARRIKLLQEIQQTNTECFIPIECDTSDLQQVHVTCTKIRDLNLHPTLFFLNAGMGEPQYDFDPLIPINEKTFNTNYFGPLAWIDEWLPTLKTCDGGTFVATVSAMTFIALPGANAYSSSKTALTHCFESLRRQYINKNMGFSSVFSGPVDTNMLKGSPQKLPFTHTAANEAAYIIDQVFAGKKNIYPSFIYTILFKALSTLPDWAIVTLANIKTAQP